MKAIIFSVVVLLTSLHTAKAQEWQSFSAAQKIGKVSWTLGDFGETYRLFRINKYDNSLWFIQYRELVRIDANGELTIFTKNEIPAFAGSSLWFEDIAFTSNAVYISDDHDIFRFQNDTWVKIQSINRCISIHADGDTLWFGRISNPYFVIEPTQTYFAGVEQRYITSKNGNTWYTNSISNGLIKRMINNQTYMYYNADTIDYFLDNGNYCFKHSPNSNYFYVSGNQGFSIALGDSFVDTLTKYNTSNMPDLPILEFEFDQDDNIWAIFGTAVSSLRYPEKIGFLDRVTNEWTIYDSTNSPIHFEYVLSLKLDNTGNLWVVDDSQLHLLKLGTEPTWLGVEENEQPNVELFPNPVEAILTIKLMNEQIDKITITDLFGKEVAFESLHSLQDVHHLNVSNLQAGVYFVRVNYSSGKELSKKWVKR